MIALPATPDLLEVARRVIWFEPPEQALQNPYRFLAYALEHGFWEDVSPVLRSLGAEALREALDHAPPGIIRPRAWSYWNARAGRFPPPPMPRRTIPEGVTLVGYARVSTLDENPQLQHEALRTAGCDRIFAEKASGAQRDRPALTAALDYARQGATLVVWKLDRLARSTRQLIATVEELEGRGLGFRSLTEAIDTTAPNGKLVFQVFAALAAFERNLIRKRTRADEAAQLPGKHAGRPKKLSPEDIKAIKALVSAGDESLPQIARRFGCSLATLYRHVPAARSNGNISAGAWHRSTSGPQRD